MKSFRRLFLVGCWVAVGAVVGAPASAQTRSDALSLTSSAFEHGEAIPLRHSAYGENLSPALAWTGAPADVGSFALVLDDTDAAGPRPFVHWVLYNLPGDLTELPEGLPVAANLDTPPGARQGATGIRRTGYFGPRPPSGVPHHYNFRLYALSSPPNLPDGLDRDGLLEAIRPFVLAETILVGTFQME